MNHDRAAPFVPELISGGLQNPEKDRVAAHLSDCSECQQLADTYRDIEGAFQDAATAPHPSSEDIARFAAMPADLDEADHARIRAHVSTCVSCTMEVDVIRRSEAEFAEETLRSSEQATRRDLRNVALMAAGVALVVLSYPAYLGLKGLNAPPSAVATEKTSASGPIAFLYLSPVRSSDEAATLTIDPGRPFVALAFADAALGATDGSNAVELAIIDGEGVTSWSRTLPAVEWMTLRDGNGTITVLVPSQVLTTGDHSLRLMAVRGDERQLSLDAPFRVRVHAQH